MNITVLTSTQAFNPGAEIWVAPPPAASTWSRKLDWYLNFQMAKGSHHQSSGRSLPLENILQKIGWSLPQHFLATSDSLLIASLGRLPCNWVLMLNQYKSDESSMSKTLNHLSKIWLDLRKPRLRLFAPMDFSHQQLSDSWSRNLSSSSTSAATAKAKPSPSLPNDFEFVEP